MEDVNRGTSAVSQYRLGGVLHELGSARKVQRQALEHVTDQLRAAVRLAHAEGLSDAYIARTAQVSVTTVREWLGKRDNRERDA